MAFQFNFDVGETIDEGKITSNDVICDAPTDVACENMKSKKQDIPCVSLSLNEILSRWKNSDTPYSIEWIELNRGEKIYYVRSHTAECNFIAGLYGGNDTVITMQDTPKSGANFLKTSDLIPQLYEGGLKIWDCSIDLANFVAEADVNLKNQTVLEIGCGIGLPGMVAAKASAKGVIFQDFNEFVLDTLTGPSVYLNELIQTQENKGISEKIELLDCVENENGSIASEIFDMDCPSSDKFTFISGDWSSVQSCLKTKVDVILSSETIYDPSNYEKLHSLICKSLRRNGTAYIAAKSFYFGVGGGIQSWTTFVTSKRILIVERIHVVDVPLKREILKMTFREN